MIARVKFWLAKKPFVYTRTGSGIAFVGYNPFFDAVRVRLSQFGYVTGHRSMSRTDYLARAEMGCEA